MSAAPDELNASLEIATDIAADIGEGPIWDEETGTLLFVDSTIGRIYRLDPTSGTLCSLEVGQQIGAAIPRRKGGLSVSARDGLMSIEEGGEVRLLVPIEFDHKDRRMNDAKCDSHGRLWSGTFSLTFAREAGSLYRVDQDLALTRVQDRVSISNGIAWSPDEATLYYVDTASRGIDMFDYDLTTGVATNRRRFVDIDRADGLPDGITVDQDGHVWVALYLGGVVRRYDPSGRWVGKVTMPIARVTSCGFGGPQLDDLYITSANHIIVDDGRPHEPHAGALFRCHPGVRGLPTHRFAG
jgi:sugar lactone lactonase YvrE